MARFTFLFATDMVVMRPNDHVLARDTRVL
jgi:hypothetical protein